MTKIKMPTKKTLVDRVEHCKLELFGHICCIQNNTMLRSVLFRMVDGHNCKGRPRKHWVGRWQTEVMRHDITTGGAPRSGSCDMEEPHSWTVWLINHGRRRNLCMTAAIQRVLLW